MEKTHKRAEAVRQGEIKGWVLRILIISLVVAIIAMSILASI